MLLATLKTKERQSANLEWAGDTIRACARVSAPCCRRLERDNAQLNYGLTVAVPVARLLAYCVL